MCSGGHFHSDPVGPRLEQGFPVGRQFSYQGWAAAVTVTHVMSAIPMPKGTETGIRAIGWPRFQQAMGGDTTMSMPVTSPGEEVLAR